MTMEFVLADHVDPSRICYDDKVLLARWIAAGRACAKERAFWRAMSEWERRHFQTVASETTER